MIQGLRARKASIPFRRPPSVSTLGAGDIHAEKMFAAFAVLRPRGQVQPRMLL